MNSSPLCAVRIVGRLSIGVSRQSIRHGHIYRYKEKQPQLTGFEQGHGEQIWVFTHIVTNMIIYSHQKFLKSNKALAQIPFTVKKQKPAKLRKDYWRPMALIQFAPGLGVVGQNVFQKLREFRRLHELSWGYQEKEFRGMKKDDRGRAIHNQKSNSIADMAAVLGGAGRGNRIVAGSEKSKVPLHLLPSRLASRLAEIEKSRPVIDGVDVETKDGRKKLVQATIFWADELDRCWARSWPKNVSHKLGLPKRYSKNGRQMDGIIDMDDLETDAVEEEAKAEAAEQDAEGTEPEPKKMGWLGRLKNILPGNLVGKKTSSSAEAKA